MTDAHSSYRFAVRDHAADKAATAYGQTLDEVFAAAAYAMFGIMFHLSTVGREEVRELALAADSGEELLRGWLNELLFLFDTEKLVFGEFAVEVHDQPWRLEGIARGQRYAESRGARPCAPTCYAPTRRGAVVKAVTYHQFALRPPQTPGGDWAAEMVFDV